MTDVQIKDYEYCKDYKADLDGFTDKLPFGIQRYGCGSRDPKITFTLEQIHRDMYETCRKAIFDAHKKVQEMIDSI